MNVKTLSYSDWARKTRRQNKAGADVIVTMPSGNRYSVKNGRFERMPK